MIFFSEDGKDTSQSFCCSLSVYDIICNIHEWNYFFNDKGHKVKSHDLTEHSKTPGWYVTDCSEVTVETIQQQR